MPTLSPSQVFLIGLIVAPVIFILSAFFLRANPRRSASGLLGGFAFGLLNIGWDLVAENEGWWHYPAFNSTGVLPPAFYFFASLVLGAFALIGWRITRRYGQKGMIAFLILWSLWGYIHDIGGSSLFASSRLMVIGPGFIPRLADFLLYMTGMALSLSVVRWVGGKFGADQLRSKRADSY